MIKTVDKMRKKGLAWKLLCSMLQGLQSSPTLALPTPLDLGLGLELGLGLGLGLG